MTAALVIAAHGTRDPAGQLVAHALTARVAALLPDVDVSVGFIELSHPTIPEALSAALSRCPADDKRVVVVPLMLGTGTHVRHDIPDFIEEVVAEFPDARIDYAPHLGPDPALFRAVNRRIDDAMGDWRREDTTLVLVGRGALVPDANADHVRLARMHYEQGGWRNVTPCFLQVTQPHLPEGLDRARAQGTGQILVIGHWLFPGRMRTWTHEQALAWACDHPETAVRVGEVIGDCDELAGVVLQRFRDMRPDHRVEGSPAYVCGLLLQDRQVLIVGGGNVAQRRVPTLLEAGAHVRLVSPTATPALEHLAGTGQIEWHRRPFEDSDLEGVWYVQATTDDPRVNRRVAHGAEARHTFCVRADDAWAGSAWTPATMRTRGATVSVLSNKDPRRSRALRDEIAGLLEGA
ncbi:CbiX/SirB N-terminal domain-containing protein [Tessaracoccus antarcticus]|nr:CbiX/SirB N-terminal domain-containing protein [Tessaracoccus antarcticus]